ncbi:MAG: Maf family protein [Myxococcota bacterium]|nr:Maf family protein [Myxococcota bacterium]
MLTIYLVSQSERRRMLLEAVGYTVEVKMNEVDETLTSGLAVERALVEVAERKMGKYYLSEQIAVAADTMVVLGDKELGKPASDEDAGRMLRSLSGVPHRVLTSFCVGRLGVKRTQVVDTEVCFRKLSELEINRYVASGEGRDKAGAYAIQGKGGLFVDQIKGSYTNVIGLPLAEVVAIIESLT